VRFSIDLRMHHEGRVILDLETALILNHLARGGSMLSASRKLGIPYSRVWEDIARAERNLGSAIIEARRGSGGGSRITELGRDLLNTYAQVLRKRLGKSLDEDLGSTSEVCGTIYAGSYDPLILNIVRKMRSEGYCIELNWVGALTGLLMVSLGMADIAGIHIIDPVTGEYNSPLVRRLGLVPHVVLIEGYFRIMGIVHGGSVRVRSIEDLVRYRLVNRNPGSGARLLLDLLLEDLARRMEMSMVKLARSIEGYGNYVNTDAEVVDAVVNGDADVGLAALPAAVGHDVRFEPVIIESFDIVISRTSLGDPAVSRFLELIRSVDLPRGYIPRRTMGRFVDFEE